MDTPGPHIEEAGEHEVPNKRRRAWAPGQAAGSSDPTVFATHPPAAAAATSSQSASSAAASSSTPAASVHPPEGSAAPPPPSTEEEKPAEEGHAEELVEDPLEEDEDEAASHDEPAHVAKTHAEGGEEERPLEVDEEVEVSSMDTEEREWIPVELASGSEGGSSNARRRLRQKTTPQK